MLEHGIDETDLGPEVCNCMLFVHAILGCDTTSSLYGIGKKISLKLSKLFRAGQIYKGLPDDTLNVLRFQRFHQKVGSSTSPVQPEVLPPT